jgi:hypothetical protein
MKNEAGHWSIDKGLSNRREGKNIKDTRKRVFLHDVNQIIILEIGFVN